MFPETVCGVINNLKKKSKRTVKDNFGNPRLDAKYFLTKHYGFVKKIGFEKQKAAGYLIQQTLLFLKLWFC